MAEEHVEYLVIGSGAGAAPLTATLVGAGKQVLMLEKGPLLLTQAQSRDGLSDFKREVSRQYGTLLEDKFLSQRAYILIDRNGIVRWTFAEETTGIRRENAELLERIRALR